MLTHELAVPLGDKTERCPKLKVIDVSATLAEVCTMWHFVFFFYHFFFTLWPFVKLINSRAKAIRRTHNGESVSYLFTNAPV